MAYAKAKGNSDSTAPTQAVPHPFHPSLLPFTPAFLSHPTQMLLTFRPSLSDESICSTYVYTSPLTLFDLYCMNTPLMPPTYLSHSLVH